MTNEIDSRISILMENCLKLHHRGFFVIVGDQAKNQVANIYSYLCKLNFTTKPSVLWCYKKELGFSIYKAKRIKEANEINKQKGTDDNKPVTVDHFQNFTTNSDIQYCLYKDSQRVLGQTYQMLILQDFEAFTPNILCRTIETVSGSGFVFLLLKSMASLKQVYSLKMDAHNRFRTDRFNEIDPRFNERFILSLSKSGNTIVMDDQLNILPISSHNDSLKLASLEESLITQQSLYQLNELKDFHKSNSLIHPFVQIAKTVDQAKAIVSLIETIQDKSSNRQVVSLTASRGRGKSATIGVAVASAIAFGFSNIYLTAPSPESLKTVFDFIFSGLGQIGLELHKDYNCIQSTNPEQNNAIIKVNIYKNHKQVIQYIAPTEYASISHADLLVIDEAAAIPLTFVKQFLGPYKVILSSTINGYEGTGRSLSLKLIQQLRDKNKANISDNNLQQFPQQKQKQEKKQSQHGLRSLKEVILNDPIRYASNDPIEGWLNGLLCLEATQAVELKNELPSPNDCELLMVNKDTLFSYKKPTEQFLFNLMSLFISSHYKNSPNDLQLLSDAPSHAIFVLMSRVKTGEEKKLHLPDILCAVQVALEGGISKETFDASNERGIKPAGDLIPWTISEQFHDRGFQSLFGARVVRIATHPGAVKMGYGSKSLELLAQFFEGNDLIDGTSCKSGLVLESYQLASTKNSAGEKKLKPLLKRLNEIQPPDLDYLGVAFGLSKELFKFWKKCGYSPLYLRQIKNELTAEHSCIMLRPLTKKEHLLGASKQLQHDWLESYKQDFKKRILSLLAHQFRDVDVQLSLGLIDPAFIIDERVQNEKFNTLSAGIFNDKVFKSKLQVETFMTMFDLTRLEAYTKKNIALNLIIDLICDISKHLFQNRFDVGLTITQSAIFLGLGLQHKSIENLAKELSMPANSIFGIFNKGIRKVTSFLATLFEQQAESTLQIEGSLQQNEKMNNKGADQNDFNTKRPFMFNIPEEIQEQEDKIDGCLTTKKLKTD